MYVLYSQKQADIFVGCSHGKRSGVRSQAQLIVPENSEETIATLTNPEDTRWFVSRLIGSAKNNNIWRTDDDTDILEAEQRPGDESVVVPQQIVEFPSQEDIESPSGDVVLMAAAPEEQASRRRAHKLRLYNIMVGKQQDRRYRCVRPVRMLIGHLYSPFYTP
uniref:Uncharacterized protein n=1 Tax=Timema shepardi TaxID=629360 RepID=A0A7R9G0X8_TIMSH|nr:unnamed protein product [Timema shepardi]